MTRHSTATQISEIERRIDQHLAIAPEPAPLAAAVRARRRLLAPARWRGLLIVVLIGVVGIGLRMLVPVGVVWLQAPSGHVVVSPGAVEPIVVDGAVSGPEIHRVAARREDVRRWVWITRHIPDPWVEISAGAFTTESPPAAESPGPADGAPAVSAGRAGTTTPVPGDARRNAASPVEATLAGVPQSERQLLDEHLQFTHSRLAAVVAAADLAGVSVDSSGAGAAVRTLPLVEAPVPGGPQLRDGDVIVSVEGEPAWTAHDVLAAATAADAAGKRSISVTVAGRDEVFAVPLAGPGALGRDMWGPLGFGVETVAPHLDGAPVSIGGSIGRHDVGASAGLAFALAAWSRLEPDAARVIGSRHIAATGVIHESGQVESVNAVDQKIAAARRAGMSVLFIPIPDEHHAPAAPRTSGRLTIVEVRTLSDAVDWLDT